MILTMIVGLYTSRVILQVLGIDDYGIYSAVGGVVGLMTFLNSALATGSSRFLTFELGRGNMQRLKSMFSTLLTAHIFLGVIIVILCETIGLWLVCNKLVIPDERYTPAIWCFHFSVVTCFMAVVQVPFNAIIISHEKMKVYAYTSIVDSILKLSIVYMLLVSPIDKLVFYAILLMLENIGVIVFYMYYCIHNFSATSYSVIIDKPILKEVLSYSAWNLLSNIGVTLKNQGAVVLVNMFFSPSVVTAQTLANKVSAVGDQFVTNFRTAANPQIVKRYASGDFIGSETLMLTSTKYSYYLVLFIGLPVVLVAEPLLKLWLGQVPEYSVEFLQLIMITSMINVFNSSLYTAIYATGNIRNNAISGSIIWLLVLPIAYVCFIIGCSPISIAVVTLICNVVLSLVQKPILLHTTAKYSWKGIIKLFSDCLKVTVVATPIPIIIYLYKDILIINKVLEFVLLILISVMFVSLSVWFVGLESEIRKKIIALIKARLNND